MINLIPYHRNHADIFIAKEEDLRRYGNIDLLLDSPLTQDGYCFTAVADGRIMAMGGVYPVSTHTGYCWTLISDYASFYGVGVFKTVKKQLETIMVDLKLHRVETSNLADAHDHHKWCKLLGFVEEGRMVCYDDQMRDYIRFAKFMKLGGQNGN
jgi:hypothetical protein